MRQLSKKEAIYLILEAWTEYRDAQRKAHAKGKASQAIRKAFYKSTWIQLPILCDWETKQDMINQYTN